MSMLTGFKSTDLDSYSKVDPATVTKFGYKRQGVDVNAISAVYSLGAVTLASGTTTSIAIMSPAFTVQEGDFLDKAGVRSEITNVSSTSYTLGRSISGLASGDSVTIYRPIYLLADSTGALFTAGGGDVNIAQYGGVATSLGQKANAASIPIVISSEQVPEVQDLDLTPMGKFLISAFQDGYSIPLEQDSFGRGLRTLSALQDGSGNNVVSATAAPGGSDRGLITRSLDYGFDGSTPTGMSVNSLGEQRAISGYATITTDTITAPLDTVVAACLGYQSALIEISGTYTSVNLTFEISVDGTNFTAASARNLTTNVIQSSTGILTNTRTMYRLTVAGATHVRARCTNFVSGTQTVKIAPSAFPAESVQTSTVYQGAGWTSYLLDQNGSFLDKQDNNWTSEYGIVNLYYDSANSWWSAMQGDVNGPYVQINGQVSCLELFRHGTATLSSVSASASSVTLLASNTNRRKAHFYNDSAYLCYLKFGSSASSTSFTTIVQPGGYFAIDVAPPYYGIITGIWPTASGTMRVTEETF